MLHMRSATIEDVGLVARLETEVTPDDPRDPALLAFWWTHEPGAEVSTRWLAERGLHLNEEMGYQAVNPELELHRELRA